MESSFLYTRVYLDTKAMHIFLSNMGLVRVWEHLLSVFVL